MKVALVLGAGGMVGLAYHAGALRALEQEGGFDPTGADLIIGTSAGSVIGAYLRSGWTTTDFWELALGMHPILNNLERLGGLGEAASGEAAVGVEVAPPPTASRPSGPFPSELREIPRVLAPALDCPLCR